MNAFNNIDKVWIEQREFTASLKVFEFLPVLEEGFTPSFHQISPMPILVKL